MPTKRVEIELVRRPPVGTRWREIDVMTRDQDDPTIARGFNHHYRKVLECDVVVTAQEPEREVLELVVGRHENIADGQADRALGTGELGSLAPGTKIRVERVPRGCHLTADDAPLSGIRARNFLMVFDCDLPTRHDDVLFAVSGEHHVGDTWAMSQRAIERLLDEPFLHLKEASVRLERLDEHERVPTFSLTASYEAPAAKATFAFRVPLEPTLPVLHYESSARNQYETVTRRVDRTLGP